MRRSIEMLTARTVAAVVGLGVILAGCSDIYYDRRETILFGADDAVASNIAVQTIDPWPRDSSNHSTSTSSTSLWVGEAGPGRPLRRRRPARPTTITSSSSSCSCSTASATARARRTG